MIEVNNESVTLSLNSDQTYDLPFLWLRDNCQCDLCRISETEEKQFLLHTVPADIRPESVEVKENTLTISGKASDKDTDTFVHRGIAQRSFKRQWTLAEHLEVTSAVLKDGVLKVDMKLNLPEEKKPKTITVK